MPSKRPSRSAGAFFGRRRGKKLRVGQAELLAASLADLRLDLSAEPPADLTGLFAVPVSEIRLEIGFGGGEHLHHETGRFPKTGFIGVEPFVNGMAKLAGVLAREPRSNIRLHDDDATEVLDWLPDGSLSAIDLLYPDPWPKRKHWKRRFVNQANLARFARVLQPGGRFRFASDIDTYVNWTILKCSQHPDFIWQAQSADDWRRPFEGWPGTRYEAKALREGRIPAYLTFVRR